MLAPRLRTFASLVATLGAFAVVLLASTASAQDQPSPAPTAQLPADQAPTARPPVVTLPVLKKNEGAAYPKLALDEGFREPVDVGLTLTIDATGVVTRAVVEKPAGHGFDEA